MFFFLLDWVDGDGGGFEGLKGEGGGFEESRISSW